ncbi:hypothetical protein AVEN_103347-1 [Araneus ventricosus]|uniref:Uncharacterized protein n=1 Tax=Araneus ventricosus TaxID=182803 RepID=A0A4Y2K9V4_ARAVE|nr:hypothetical protein AVEN_103347-1 [Araneus ventricosus]
MDTFLYATVFLQLLFCCVQVAVFGEFIFVLPILGYAVLGELFKYVQSLMMSALEEATSGADFESCSMKQTTIPVVRKRRVWLLCKALDMEAELAVEDSVSKRMPVPTVRNPIVWSQCRRLGLDAKLEFPPHAVLLRADDIPTVNSRVYLLCDALGLKAKTAR